MIINTNSYNDWVKILKHIVARSCKDHLTLLRHSRIPAALNPSLTIVGLLSIC